MLAVTAYPILYAIWLSLNKADLRRPNANEFIWFDNYVTVLSQPDLVDGVRRHHVHHGGQRVPRAGVRHAARDRHAPHDRRTRAGAHLGAGARTAIVTVVAAFSWRFAWTEGLGYLTPERIARR